MSEQPISFDITGKYCFHINARWDRLVATLYYIGYQDHSAEWEGGYNVLDYDYIPPRSVAYIFYNNGNLTYSIKGDCSFKDFKHIEVYYHNPTEAFPVKAKLITKSDLIRVFGENVLYVG